MRLRPYSRSTARSQRGYVLLVILVMLAVVMLALLASAPAIAAQIRRDREEELIHRGRQYAIAIKRYYKKFGRYPTSLEDLENSNRMRFLRRRFKDPMSESGEWRLIRFGEVKTTPTGLFGKAMTAGAPAAAVGTPASQLSGGGTGPGAGTTGLTPTGSSTGPGTGSGSPAPMGSGTDALAGRTFGGGPIVGVASTSTKESLKELNGKNHYNDWEFFYDPRFDVGPGGAPGAVPQQQLPGATPQQPNQPNPSQNPGMPR
jgi:type II secretory pathway pseudopilin PulG